MSHVTSNETERRFSGCWRIGRPRGRYNLKKISGFEVPTQCCRTFPAMYRSSSPLIASWNDSCFSSNPISKHVRRLCADKKNRAYKIASFYNCCKNLTFSLLQPILDQFALLRSRQDFKLYSALRAQAEAARGRDRNYHIRQTYSRVVIVLQNKMASML